MATVMAQEDLAVDTSPSARTPYREVAAFAEDLRPEERTDLTIEIASDDDKASALFAKARLYLEKGGRMVWLIFPLEKKYAKSR